MRISDGSNIWPDKLPCVTVILPIYNGQSYLESAINSVLQQSYSDFELVIINDGSVDDSVSIVESFSDSRIRFYQQQNQGLAATLNKAIGLARGKYIARQDQDDVYFPNRLQKQVDFLEQNVDVAMVGAAAEIWVGNERTDRLLKHPTDDASIRFGLLFDNYFVHSSVMLRRSVLEGVGGYSEDKARQPPEDYELWSRLMRMHKLANLPEVLMAYREVPSSMSRAGNNPFLHNLVKISTENIAWASDCAVNSADVVALSKLMHGDYDGMPHIVKFSQLRAVLDRAMLCIAKESGVPSKQMVAISRGRVNRLRYHYVDYLCGGLLGKALNSQIGCYVKNMVRRLLMKETY
ncbi:MAG: glycosyltransferase [Sideroxydans sp.]|nr:glycosyltransferase [Sideroxydans sp.]